MATEKDVEKHISGEMAIYPRSQTQAWTGWQLPNQIIPVCKTGKLVKTSHLVRFGWLFPSETEVIPLNQNILQWKA